MTGRLVSAAMSAPDRAATIRPSVDMTGISAATPGNDLPTGITAANVTSTARQAYPSTRAARRGIAGSRSMFSASAAPSMYSHPRARLSKYAHGWFRSVIHRL